VDNVRKWVTKVEDMFIQSKAFSFIASRPNWIAFFASFIAIVIGLLIGLLIMLIFNPRQSLDGFFLITGGWVFRGSNLLRDLGRWLFTTGPLLMTGLSVGFAFKTGLFNIGATGQYTLGMFVAIWVGFYGGGFGPFQWVIGVLGGMVAGALLGLVNGFLKARFNVHEVITSIMFNYIVMYFVNSTIKSNRIMFDSERGITNAISSNAYLPTLGLRTFFPGSPIDVGIVLAILIAIAMWFVLYRTKFGFELQATGLNRFAAKYAGINENRSIILSMTIAGGLAGFGGTLYFLASGALSIGTFYEPADILIGTGFEGIAVALLGMSNPVGTIFSAGFITFVQRGGQYMQGLGIKIEIIEVIIASILYASAISLLFKEYFNRLKLRGDRKEESLK
jgi:general nucleoside transport system permease protein